MNNILNEVGLELELFLLDKDNNIVEPSLYGFPSDEMGFLIEIRSEHSWYWDDITGTLYTAFYINECKASKINLSIVRNFNMKVSNEFIEYYSNKYRYSELPDFTKNVYGKSGVTHHTGIIGDTATAGLHVHFSRRVIEDNKCKLVNLPVEEIVKSMDNKFRSHVIGSNRLLGEYEHKAHGFEYRSLPNTIPIERVTKYALKLLESV